MNETIVIERSRCVQSDSVQRRHLFDRKPNRTNAIAADPHAGVFAPARALQAETCARRENGFLELSYQRYDFAKALELHNRIDDDLSRPVIRDIPAALDLKELDALRREGLAREKQAIRLSLTADRDDRIVLDDDPRVALRSGRNVRMQPALQRPDFAERSSPQIEKPCSRDRTTLRRAAWRALDS